MEGADTHMATKKGIRATRTEHVLRPKGNYAYGSDFLSGLIKSARLLLIAARDEKPSKGGRNFLTFHGPAAIVLSVTAFEVFLNEALHACLRRSTNNQPTFEALVKRDSLVEKFTRIPGLVTGGPELANPDVALVQLVRHEIVHFYPPIGSGGIPDWLQPLADKGLLYSIGTHPHDIGWPQKVESFQLALWCATTIISAVNQFAHALQGEPKTMVALQAQSGPAYFRMLRI